MSDNKPPWETEELKQVFDDLQKLGVIGSVNFFSGGVNTIIIAEHYHSFGGGKSLDESRRLSLRLKLRFMKMSLTMRASLSLWSQLLSEIRSLLGRNAMSLAPKIMRRTARSWPIRTFFSTVRTSPQR